MNNMENYQCPFSQSECVTTACRLYDERLNNCALNMIFINLYKLERTIASITPKDEPGIFPFPPQRKN